MKRRVTILISGRVQGVLYRANTIKRAKQLNLTGWAKNEANGKVKIVAEGIEENLEQLIKWAKQGSVLAKVDKIELKWDKRQGEFKDFVIVY